MSERPNDASDRPRDEAGTEPPIEDEGRTVEPDGALDEGADDGDARPAADDLDVDIDDDTLVEDDGELAEDEMAAVPAEADVQRVRGMRPSERRAARSSERTHLTIDPSLRIQDRASALFVVLTVAVFAVILLNGIVLGKGGFLAPLATPTPIPTLAPTPAATECISFITSTMQTCVSGSTRLPTSTKGAAPGGALRESTVNSSLHGHRRLHE